MIFVVQPIWIVDNDSSKVGLTHSKVFSNVFIAFFS